MVHPGQLAPEKAEDLLVEILVVADRFGIQALVSAIMDLDVSIRVAKDKKQLVAPKFQKVWECPSKIGGMLLQR